MEGLGWRRDEWIVDEDGVYAPRDYRDERSGLKQ